LSKQNVAWMTELFRAIDAKDTTSFLGFLSEGASFRFGNADPVVGRANINTAVEAFFASIRSSRHGIEHAWFTPAASACHGTVTYTRNSGSTVTLPFANAMYHLDGGEIQNHLILIDIAPLYAD
jgi:hypothetical protein